MLQFTFLGTSSGVPSLTRNVSGLAIHLNKSKDWILVDAGEGTQHRIQQAKLSLQHLKAICITHVHGDHCYGLMGLLASAGMNGRKEPMIIIAPKEIQQWFEATCQFTELFLPYPIEFLDVNALTQPYELNESISIEPIQLSHRVESYAFGIKAIQTQRKLNVEKLAQLEIPKGKLWGDVQQGQNIEWNGRTIFNQDLVIETTQQVYAIVGGDNDQPNLLAQQCKNADLLIHDTTYTQAVLDKVGAGPMHSSAKMVAEFVESVKLPHLIATHLSPRYHDEQGIQTIHDEIAQHYRGQFFVANDFDRYELNADGDLTLIDSGKPWEK
ncbi:ribonuclease Z [Acinetobacter wuhouensis]|uniref:Ribonuclease Z n=1 Tax=Acinetobacter wuhouensis TaxID=1879050 RepID=A0A3G2T3M7_9GAMM|nr:ribonuclease Z [Acinetobacter wuhouensis]AYO54869.1 MBL fold metallo-hydrolase [Acinetobacter wuhouensis]